MINQGDIEEDGKTDDVFQRRLTPFVAEVDSMKNVFEASCEAITSGNWSVGDSFSCDSLHLGYLLVCGGCRSIAQDLSTERTSPKPWPAKWLDTEKEMIKSAYNWEGPAVHAVG